MFAEIINTYGAEIIGTLLLAMAGIFGMIAKNMAAKYLDTDTKRTLAKVVVQFVEQAYKELHGQEKLQASLSVFADMLREKNIHATETEMLVLIEAAVAEFNEVFKKPVDSEESKATYRVPEGGA
jgi:hypothetical protein